MNQERPSSLDISPEYRVRGCNTLDELYYVLRDIGEVQGSKQVYTGEQLVDLIQSAAKLRSEGMNAVRQGLRYVPQALGIRQKAHDLIELLPREAAYSR